MTQNDIWNQLSSINLGTVIAWVAVIGAIVTFVIKAVERFYGIFDHFKELKASHISLSNTVDTHNEQLGKITEQLEKIQTTLDRQDATELKKLRHSIIRSGEDALSQGKISIRALRSLEELYEEYHDERKGRRGNSYVTTLMQKVRTLPVIGQLDENGNDVE